MKNYQLKKFLVAKTGIIHVSNQFGHRWLELRFKGRLVRTIHLHLDDYSQGVTSTKHEYIMKLWERGVL